MVGWPVSPQSFLYNKLTFSPANRIMKNPQFKLDDFRKHFQNIKKMGLKDMVGRTPGMAEMFQEGEDPDVALERVAQMIDAMTAEERNDPGIIDSTRRQRIANDAGVEPPAVSDFLKQFAEVQALMDRMMSMSVWQRIKMVLGIREFPRLPPPS